MSSEMSNSDKTRVIFLFFLPACFRLGGPTNWGYAKAARFYLASAVEVGDRAAALPGSWHHRAVRPRCIGRTATETAGI